MKKILPIIITLSITGLVILMLAFLASKPSSSPAKDLAVPPKADDISIGSMEAKVTLVEYSDFQCPACGSFYPVIKQLKSSYHDQPVRFIFRHFPLSNIHPYAQLAAEAAEAAREQGKFWEMADKLYNNQDQLDQKYLLIYAQEIGLDIDKFSQSLNGGVYRNKVLADFDSGVKSGVPGTPSIFINAKYYQGKRTLEELVKYINKLLESK